MAHTNKACFDDRASWDETLSQHRDQLRFYLDYLVQCDCSQQILANIEAEVRERSVPNDFKFRFLVRTLVQQAIKHWRERILQSECPEPSASDSTSSTPDIPVEKRLVYLMRDILRYSTRETSLLIGMTDAHVESLLSFARTRVNMFEGPSTLEIQAPDSNLLPREVRESSFELIA